MSALPMCVGLLSRLPVKDLKALHRIGALGKGLRQDDQGEGGGDAPPRSGSGLGGLTVYDQDGPGGKGEDGEEAERKLKVEEIKALKKKKVAVYR